MNWITFILVSMVLVAIGFVPGFTIGFILGKNKERRS